MRPIYLAALLIVGVARAQEEPPPAVAVPPPPTPAPMLPPPPPAPVPTALAPEFLAPQPVYGPMLRVEPAHRIALVEAGAPMYRRDARVRDAADLLSRVTGVYVEDAPRIAELTVRVCLEIRVAERPASPVEMLEASLKWRSHGGVYRQFEEFAALYRKLRVKEKKDHKEAMAVIGNAASK